MTALRFPKPYPCEREGLQFSFGGPFGASPSPNSAGFGRFPLCSGTRRSQRTKATDPVDSLTWAKARWAAERAANPERYEKPIDIDGTYLFVGDEVEAAGPRWGPDKGRRGRVFEVGPRHHPKGLVVLPANCVGVDLGVSKWYPRGEKTWCAAFSWRKVDHRAEHAFRRAAHAWLTRPRSTGEAVGL